MLTITSFCQGTWLLTWTFRLKWITDSYPSKKHRPRLSCTFHPWLRTEHFCKSSQRNSSLFHKAHQPLQNGCQSLRWQSLLHMRNAWCRGITASHFEQDQLVVSVPSWSRLSQFNWWDDVFRSDVVLLVFVMGIPNKALISAPQEQVSNLLCLQHSKRGISVRASASSAIMTT